MLYIFMVTLHWIPWCINKIYMFSSWWINLQNHQWLHIGFPKFKFQSLIFFRNVYSSSSNFVYYFCILGWAAISTLEFVVNLSCNFLHHCYYLYIKYGSSRAGKGSTEFVHYLLSITTKELECICISLLISANITSLPVSIPKKY